MSYPIRPTSNPEIIPTERIYWLAGMFDGEGTITKGSRNKIVLRVNSTDKDIVDRCQEFSGMGSISGPYQYNEKPTRENTKANWYWTVYKKRDVYRLLLAMAPLLCERRKQRIMEMVDERN